MTATEATLLAVHLAATGYMMGLIWFVQLVHYPAFDRVDRTSFGSFESWHQRRTSWIVGPGMAIEGVCAIAIAATAHDLVGWLPAVTGLVLLGGIHASTVALQVPIHRRLTAGHDPELVRRLVRTNWIRTVGWTLRTVVAIVMIIAAA